MQGTTAKELSVKWPTSTLKELSSNKRKIQKCRSVARVKNVPFITLTSCKIFKVVKVQAVVLRTMTSYNKRCSALKKQVICFLETLVNTYQTTSCRSLEDNNMTISLLPFAICHSVLLLVQAQVYFCRADGTIGGIVHSTNLFLFYRNPSTTAESNHALFSFRIHFSQRFNLVIYISRVFHFFTQEKSQ
jgi:hypothetical protein